MTCCLLLTVSGKNGFSILRVFNFHKTVSINTLQFIYASQKVASDLEIRFTIASILFASTSPSPPRIEDFFNIRNGSDLVATFATTVTARISK